MSSPQIRERAMQAEAAADALLKEAHTICQLAEQQKRAANEVGMHRAVAKYYSFCGACSSIRPDATLRV